MQRTLPQSYIGEEGEHDLGKDGMKIVNIRVTEGTSSVNPDKNKKADIETHLGDQMNGCRMYGPKSRDMYDGISEGE